MFENRRVVTKTAECLKDAFGDQGESKYIDGVMLYNKLMNDGNNGALTQVLGEQLDRMDKLVATERASKVMLEAALQSLQTKKQNAEDFT